LYLRAAATTRHYPPSQGAELRLPSCRTTSRHCIRAVRHQDRGAPGLFAPLLSRHTRLQLLTAAPVRAERSTSTGRRGAAAGTFFDSPRAHAPERTRFRD